MNYLTKILFGISAVFSLGISLLFVVALIAWLNGGGSVLLPGLGLIITMGLIVVVLLIMAAVSIFITYLLARLVFKKDVSMR